MPTSFIKSTIDLCQSNFSGFFFAKSLRMAATSTTGGATAVAGAAALVIVGQRLAPIVFVFPEPSWHG